MKYQLQVSGGPHAGFYILHEYVDSEAAPNGGDRYGTGWIIIGDLVEGWIPAGGAGAIVCCQSGSQLNVRSFEGTLQVIGGDGCWIGSSVAIEPYRPPSGLEPFLWNCAVILALLAMVTAFIYSQVRS